ncbi:SP_1767 family glycosyltransferase [Granulicatella sp. 19428wC4_WM01]|nr:SP_1767 family glycosyltransferase [Granulicatella sp. 19428wC4_WM01]TFU95737.1 SP_1767 family glycosyltransferase [Granulicatella sp. WM01]
MRTEYPGEYEQFSFSVKPIHDSLDYILAHNSSVARFGDGEIDIIAGHSIPYQEYDAALACELANILSQQSTPNFLVCLPDVFEQQERYQPFTMNFWKEHLIKFSDVYHYVCAASWYGSTFISRPYIDLVDKSASKQYFGKLKKIWDNKDILIVEGVSSRSGVGNDLFDNARSIQRIICPPKNAFSYYEEIAHAIRQHGKHKLVLLMLGPTAKVLSYHLSQEGYRTIDIGHIDSEYEWYKMGAETKVKLSNKHTAEFNHDEHITYHYDSVYLSQIVYQIGKEHLPEKINEQKEVVTVIVPVYNAEKYLRTCIDSILRQTYASIRLLLINDGSTDSSAQICEEYAQQDERVFVHHKLNGGVAEARNYGLSIAKHIDSEYILFVDCDDWLEINHIEKLHTLLKKTDSDIAIGNFTAYHQNKNTFAFHIHQNDIFEKTYTVAEWFKEEYQPQWCLSQCFTVPWAKLYKKSLLNHIVYPVGKRVEDDYTTYKVYLMAEKIAFLNESIYFHRKYENSITGHSSLIDVYPLESIEERITLLTLKGMDISLEKNAYLWRLTLHADIYKKSGNMVKYKEIMAKLHLCKC